jgi:hypothetical protein
MSRLHLVPTIACSLALAGTLSSSAQQKNDKPQLLLRAIPSVAVAPARVVLTAELRGGSDDFEEFYCPTIQWDWDDGTKSEHTSDCEPFETGKTAIKRRYTIEHVFRRDGPYKIYFHMKKKDKILASASVTIHVQPGAISPDDQ